MKTMYQSGLLSHVDPLKRAQLIASKYDTFDACANAMLGCDSICSAHVLKNKFFLTDQQLKAQFDLLEIV